MVEPPCGLAEAELCVAGGDDDARTVRRRGVTACCGRAGAAMGGGRGVGGGLRVSLTRAAAGSIRDVMGLVSQALAQAGGRRQSMRDMPCRWATTLGADHEVDRLVADRRVVHPDAVGLAGFGQQAGEEQVRRLFGAQPGGVGEPVARMRARWSWPLRSSLKGVGVEHGQRDDAAGRRPAVLALGIRQTVWRRGAFGVLLPLVGMRTRPRSRRSCRGGSCCPGGAVPGGIGLLGDARAAGAVETDGAEGHAARRVGGEADGRRR